jgi:triacylglycerol lipase
MLSLILLAILLVEAMLWASAGLWLYRQGWGVLLAISAPVLAALLWRCLIVFTTFVLAGGWRQRSASNSLRALWGESLSTLYLYSVAQPLEIVARSLRQQVASSGANKCGVDNSTSGPLIVLIHGFVCNAGMWGPLRRRLRDAGFDAVRAINLDPFYRSMRASRADYQRQLDALGKLYPEREVVLIGHSMGGVLARMELLEQPERLAYAITLGAPHAGTALARWVSSLKFGPARPDSSWLLAFNAAHAELPASIAQRLFNIWTDADNIVSPQQSAELGPDAVGLQLRRSGVGHLQLAADARVLSAIEAFLRERFPR